MKRLLIVDDALIMRRMIRDVAVEAGWEVSGEAADGQQAVSLYRQLRPDLVTLDLVMPVMGGLEALKAIRDEDPAARVIGPGPEGHGRRLDRRRCPGLHRQAVRPRSDALSVPPAGLAEWRRTTAQNGRVARPRLDVRVLLMSK